LKIIFWLELHLGKFNNKLHMSNGDTHGPVFFNEILNEKGVKINVSAEYVFKKGKSASEPKNSEIW
jgi:hypothetical protein